ncbi:NAD-dependent epimerase/dehydratase family protein [uncultured Devosia sp.]|uniref:NAD-dependent epimerase/dehydratase family protein n=1 Tax=uncultured Devosia sp. TaxID=211434 RepID=UPI00261B80FB|nr:NAD-dependent epimerase/dehydratase family protein [uncultured Devosia sp.]
MRLAITGAGGFVGRKVVELALARSDCRSITITDCSLPSTSPDPRLRVIEGDIADPLMQDAVLADADAVIHLAAVLGGAAEADPEASRRMNLDAALDLIHRARGRRFVLASSIAVYGKPPAIIDDDTPCAPTLIYAMHKRMAEIALETAVRRGEIDGVALRIPGVVARPDLAQGLKSAFLSNLFHAMRQGRGFTMPVAPEGRSPIASVHAVAAALLHAAVSSITPGDGRSLLLPALSVQFSDLEAALRQRFPSAPPITYRPDPDVMQGFGMFGDVQAADATHLGYPADRTLAELIARAL